jgi:hypothetical protein
MNPLYIYIAFGVWTLVLTGFMVWIFIFFRVLSKNVEGGNLITILKKVVQEGSLNSKGIKTLEKEIARIDEKSLSYIQSIGLVKFNPFEEMGGDHSFSLALIDAKKSGFIITGLHTRERTRVYIKRVKMGKSEYELSKEEQKALAIASKRV